MKTLREFIEESAYSGKDDAAVHNDLIKAGLKPAQLGYTANHSHAALHKILTKHGYKPVTHYMSDGRPMPKPHSVYEKESRYTRHVAQMQVKGGKITHIRTDSHKDTW